MRRSPKDKNFVVPKEAWTRIDNDVEVLPDWEKKKQRKKKEEGREKETRNRVSGLLPNQITHDYISNDCLRDYIRNHQLLRFRVIVSCAEQNVISGRESRSCWAFFLLFWENFHWRARTSIILSLTTQDPSVLKPIKTTFCKLSNGTSLNFMCHLLFNHLNLHLSGVVTATYLAHIVPAVVI